MSQEKPRYNKYCKTMSRDLYHWMASTEDLIKFLVFKVQQLEEEISSIKESQK